MREGAPVTSLPMRSRAASRTPGHGGSESGRENISLDRDGDEDSRERSTG
jgi:hypothetical protein